MQLQLPGWMGKDTTNGSAGQKPNAGAVAQVLDTMTGQQEKPNIGVVTIGMPKINERYGCAGL